MTRAKALEELLRGSAEWGRWRGDDEYRRIDLRGASLRNADLRGYDLRHVDLTGADLVKANLSYTTLYAASMAGAQLSGVTAKGTVFTDADLEDSKLDNTVLIGANFGGAQLGDSDLRSADLCIVNFSGADLSGTDLSRAKVWDTSFCSVDLSRAILNDIEFQGPCDIGLETLTTTARHLPSSGNAQASIEAFFRGCGVSDDWIEYFRTLIGRPVQWYSAFISYSHVDNAFARRLYDQLQGRGIRCWLDEKDLVPGDRILEGVNQAIRLHDKILLCCSRSSLTSWWVKDEVRKAMEKERQQGQDSVIPLDLDGYLLDEWNDGLASEVRSRLAANFSGWETDSSKFDEQFERVIIALKPRE